MARAASYPRPMAVHLRYRIVDVFSDRPLAGNALCVVLDPAPEPVMQAIAREVNLSETTFPVDTGDGTYDVRIFTPNDELPFAGHPSLGTAWAMGPGRWTQTSSGAVVEIDVDDDGAEMTQPDPTLTEVDAAAAIAALGLPGAEGAWRAEVGGMTHVLVLTESPIDRLTPDLAAVTVAARAAGAPSLVPVRRIDDDHLHVRAFVPGAGIAEDPGTGSAAGPIGVLAHRHWGTADAVTIRQGDEMGRPCRIQVRVGPDGVRVGGRVAACAEGGLTLGPL
ncbi:MAG: trans-2,3-dihydro-3-hydroxyanthranilate isomerase [Actinomycetota bacterium]|nr:trans-2,3-dihydro-3-hydroxyanthranilate isomerase [Actinomycetota bacterium]